jgi:tRNA U34 5-methylaminomethyl-2-thiouridine-forming methyltransferase MnmC
MDWRRVKSADGSWTLAHPVHGEACHSLHGAWTQALERYARPCRLAERAPGPLRLLDVGSGLGLNLAAALAELEPRGSWLEAVSLESDATVIEAGVALYREQAPSRGPWERWHASVREALTKLLAQGGTAHLGTRGSLRLLLGDARESVQDLEPTQAFDAVFLDPFSPRVAPELWQPAFLAAIAARMASGSWLSTYSAAFAVRRALAQAGLKVGRGPRVGAKAEGTLASPDVEPPPLSARLVRRLARS